MNRRHRPLMRQLALVLMPALTPAAALAGELTLSGEGSVRYEPDSARLQFTAKAEHALPDKASEQLRAQMARWRESIKAWQDQLQDYSDARINLYTRSHHSPKSEEPERRSVATQTVSFSIRDLTLLNPILEQAQAIGMEYQLGPHQFFHSQEEELERKALALAIADARARCEFVASQLEQTCGDVVTMTINGGHRPMPMMMADARATKESITNVGVRDINSTVNVTFELD